jgi:hypothetical protein
MVRLPTSAAIIVMLTGAFAGCQPTLVQQSAQLPREPGDSNVTLVRASFSADSAFQYLERNSCSATACHGQSQAERASWRNAYHRWENADPHRRAFEVLYTDRSIQMFRKLTQISDPRIDEGVYLRFVEAKCIGCHATQPGGSSPANLVHQASPEAYWQGVSCESCHGPASRWLDQHYLKSWAASAAAQRTNVAQQTGFEDTKRLDQRADVCLKCHLGPQQIGEQVYDVNHDLIAAGHPRLAFELHAYLANLPKHWAEASSPSLHFDTWRAGQIQQAEQESLLKQARKKVAAENQTGEWAEFAGRDCRECHHSIGEATFASQRDSSRSQFAALLKKTPANLSVAQRAELLRSMLPGHQSAEQATEIYLATSAFAHDLPAGTLTQTLSDFQQAIAAQAGRTQYDLPGSFDPQQPDFRAALIALDRELQQLHP